MAKKIKIFTTRIRKHFNFQFKNNFIKNNQFLKHYGKDSKTIKEKIEKRIYWN